MFWIPLCFYSCSHPWRYSSCFWAWPVSLTFTFVFGLKLLCVWGRMVSPKYGNLFHSRLFAIISFTHLFFCFMCASCSKESCLSVETILVLFITQSSFAKYLLMKKWLNTRHSIWTSFSPFLVKEARLVSCLESFFSVPCHRSYESGWNYLSTFCSQPFPWTQLGIGFTRFSSSSVKYIKLKFHCSLIA